MSAISNYLEAALLDAIVNEAAFTSPSTWISLYTSDPTDADTGTEVTGGSYARVRIYENAGGSPDWTLAAVDGIGYAVENDDDVTFPTPTASWGTVTHFGIHDASTSGNLLYHGELGESKTVDIDDVVKITAGNLKLRLE